MSIQWPLVLFTLLTGLGAGTFGLVALSEWWGKGERARMPAAITALVALVAAGVASIFHLGHPERIFNALGHFGSGIFFEMLLVGLTGLAALIYIVMLRSNSPVQARKVVATIGLLTAIAVSVVVGASYVLPSRPAWYTVLLPLLYLASAGVLGCFSLYFWAAVRKEADGTVLSVDRATLVAVAIEALLLLAYVVYLAAAPFQNPTRSVARLLVGDLAPIFWIGIVLIGLLVPAYLALRFLAAKGLSARTVAVLGLISAIVGGIALRVPLYLLGTSIEQFF